MNHVFGVRALTATLLVAAGIGCAPVQEDAVEEAVAEHSAALGTIPSQPGCLSTTLVNPVVLHVAVNGNDANAGTAAAPLATLAGAQAKIPVNYTRDYQIVVHGGVYQYQMVDWKRTSATHRIRIEAAANEVPIFDGRSADGHWQSVLFYLSPSIAASPVVANVVVKGLTIRYYVQHGILLGSDPADGGSGPGQMCTTLVDNTMIAIGNKNGGCATIPDPNSPGDTMVVINRPPCTGEGGALPDEYGCKCIGYGIIGLTYSAKNSIKDNKIIDGENSSKANFIHAFYVAYHSTDNLIENNYVRNVSGNPFKFRDFSSNNRVINNYAERAGQSAFFTDSPNDASEGASVNNTLSGNLVTFSYDGGHNALTLSSSTSPPSFIVDSAQTTGRYYQGDTPTQEVPTASVSADVDGDGKEEVFVAFFYPEFGFSKVVYSVAGSTELSEVAHSSSIWQVTALAAGRFGNSTNPNVIAAFWSGATETQVQRGVVEADGNYRFGAGTLLNSAGSSFWKITALAGGQVAGATAPQLFAAVSHDGVQEIHRGDGISLPSGGTKPGISNGTPLYVSSSWEIPALAVGEIDGTGVSKLVSAFHYIGSGSPLNRLYLGSGSSSGAGTGATDGGAFFSDSSTLIRALAIGKFDGTNSRLAWGADVASVGKVFLSGLSGSTITPQATQLYSNSTWDIVALARAETRSGGGDELVTAFHHSSADQIWSGNGSSANSGATSFDNYYRWP